MTWLIVAISVASFMGLMIVISIIICIVRCCRGKDKVEPESGSAVGPKINNISNAE
jgi:hypothetical protein